MNGSGAQRGFTLVEALVTIAVLTIIISLGVPLYGQFTQGSALTGRSSDLVSALNLARSEAVSRREQVRLSPIAGSWGNGWDVRVVSTDEVVREMDMRGADIGLVIVEASDLSSLDFDREGRVSSEGAFVNASFDICPAGGGGGRTIALSRFGRVELSALECPE